MAEKRLNSRIVFKNDTEENWLKATNFVPLRSELIVYLKDDTHDYVRFKIGDGTTVVNSLPFVVDPGEIEALEAKIDTLEGTSHTHSNKSVLDATTASYTTAEKTKLSGIATGAEVNQNAFSKVAVSGQTTVEADTETDTLTLVAGSNVTLTTDATNDKVTIAAKDTTYTGSNGVSISGTTISNSGVRSITQDSSDGHKLNVNINGTTSTITIPDNNTTYTVETTGSGNAVTSVTLSGAKITATKGATYNNYSLPVAGSALGGVKSGTDITVDASGNVSVNDDSHNHIISNIDGLQDALDGKSGTGHTHNFGVTAVATGDSNGQIKVTTNGSSANVSVKGLGSAAYTASTAYDAAGTATTKANAALSSAKAYTDEKVAALVNSAPEALNTLGELATALADHEDAYDALLETVGGKATPADITTAIQGLDVASKGGSGKYIQAISETDGKISATEATMPTTMKNPTSIKVQLNSGTTEGTNQYTYDGSAAKTINITPSAIGAAASSHTQAASTITGLSTVATSGSYNDLSNKPTIPTDTNTTYDLAASTSSTNGNVKLNLTAGGSGSGTDSVTIKGSGATTVTTDANGVVTISSTDNNTTYTFNGAVSTIKDSNLTASRALVSNSSGKVAVSDVTSTELSYLDGVTSAIQTQLDGKAASSHTHSSYVNQNAFSNVTVGSTTIAADTTTDTLTLVAGSNVTLTPDATNDKITIAATDTVYTHPTSGATAGTYRSVTVDVNGHVTAGSNPTITIAQGGTGSTTAAGALTNLGLTATASELNYTVGVTSNIQTQLNGKAPTSHASTATTYGAASASNYGHAMASSTTPKANGTAAVGSETTKFARGDHVHPLQTSVSGNAETATKLATARTIKLTGDVTDVSKTFDGSGDITFDISVKDDSHNHTIANIDNLQTTLDAKLPKSGGTLTGFVDFNGAKAKNAYIEGGVIDSHAESTTAQIGYFMNDLTALRTRGGSCTVTGAKTAVSTGVTDKWFDGTTSYGNFTVSATTDTVVILIKSWKNWTYGNKFGIGFGASNWRAKSIKWELGYATAIGGDPASDAWKTVGSTTSNGNGIWICSGSGPSTGGSSTPWNTIKITLTDFNGTSPRIAGIWSINYGSSTLAESLLPRIGGNVYGGLTTYGDITPNAANARNLGSSSSQWQNIYGNYVYENGTILANKYLGKDAKASDADKLDGQDSSYYLNYNNLTNKPTFTYDSTTKTLTIS